MLIDVRSEPWSPKRRSSRLRPELSRRHRAGSCSTRERPAGEPSTTYHWETEQEDFLVLSGEAILIIEGQERSLRQWDFVHCPPDSRHAFVGAGTGPCVLLCASSRQFQKDGPWGYYCPDPVAQRYNAAAPEGTQDTELAYARFGAGQHTRYQRGFLPE